MRREGDTKQKLLRTATQLMWENSYGSISVDDICERAGVNKGSFYYAFKTKSDLAVAACEEHASKKRPILDRIFSSQEPPLVRLANYCDQTVNDQLEKYQSFGKVLGCVAEGCNLWRFAQQNRLILFRLERYAVQKHATARGRWKAVGAFLFSTSSEPVIFAGMAFQSAKQKSAQFSVCP